MILETDLDFFSVLGGLVILFLVLGTDLDFVFYVFDRCDIAVDGLDASDAPN